MVGLVKSSFKNTIHRHTLDLWNFQMLVSEIEATLNTRPITPVLTNATEEGFVLRPIDPLYKYQPNYVDYVNQTESREYLNTYYAVLREAVEGFWEIWHKDYLQALVERNQARPTSKHNKRRWPHIGEVVLIRQDGTSRYPTWPLGLVIELHSSPDGTLRSVKVRTGKHRVLDRSISQLLPLEISTLDEESARVVKEKTPLRIQPHRDVKRRH
ncbi:unnamed protein product [Heligmosomoides polygyrus]|uniref:DUF5641 domain-containing protein n=1 Tax=Heligmosomoides polygyrus TaxID=6339 RepID=A0A3P7U2C9_HELPZ|nr:unnamed protein product [Heligmosomoides polygyrus]